MSNRALVWATAAICIAILVTGGLALWNLDRDDRAQPAPTFEPWGRPPGLAEQRERFAAMFREAWIPPDGPPPPHGTTACIRLDSDGRLSLIRGAGTGDARWDAAVTAASAQVMARLAGTVATPGTVCFGAPP